MNLIAAVLIAASLGQNCGPGGRCPTSQPAVMVPAQPQAPVKALYNAVVDGQVRQVLGWMENGTVRYWPQDNPQLRAKPPATKPATKPGCPCECDACTGEPGCPCACDHDDCRCPDVVGQAGAAKPDWRTSGVNVAQTFADREEHYTANGPAAQAFAAAAQGEQAGVYGDLTDDSKKPYVAIIGDEASWQRALEIAAPFKAEAHVSTFRPDEWGVSRVGLSVPGHKPEVIVQTPDGKVTGRLPIDGLTPEKLRKALREANPLYNPAADPDGSDSLFGFLEGMRTLAWIKGHLQYVVAGFVVLALFIGIRRGPAPITPR